MISELLKRQMAPQGMQMPMQNMQMPMMQQSMPKMDMFGQSQSSGLLSQALRGINARPGFNRFF